jgi:hypothetical protein
VGDGDSVAFDRPNPRAKLDRTRTRGHAAYGAGRCHGVYSPKANSTCSPDCDILWRSRQRLSMTHGCYAVRMVRNAGLD